MPAIKNKKLDAPTLIKNTPKKRPTLKSSPNGMTIDKLRPPKVEYDSVKKKFFVLVPYKTKGSAKSVYKRLYVDFKTKQAAQKHAIKTYKIRSSRQPRSRDNQSILKSQVEDFKKQIAVLSSSLERARSDLANATTARQQEKQQSKIDTSLVELRNLSDGLKSKEKQLRRQTEFVLNYILNKRVNGDAAEEDLLEQSASRTPLRSDRAVNKNAITIEELENEGEQAETLQQPPENEQAISNAMANVLTETPSVAPRADNVIEQPQNTPTDVTIEDITQLEQRQADLMSRLQSKPQDETKEQKETSAQLIDTINSFGYTVDLGKWVKSRARPGQDIGQRNSLHALISFIKLLNKKSKEGIYKRFGGVADIFGLDEDDDKDVLINKILSNLTPASLPNYRKIVHGNGADDARAGLWTQQIDDMMSSYKNYLGTISANEIPALISIASKLVDDKINKFGFIMNKSYTTEGEGSHWVAVFLDLDHDKSIEYFDSFGNDPDDRFYSDIKFLVDSFDLPYMLKLKINKIKVQHASNNMCGFFAMKFLMDRFNNKPFKEVTGYSDIKKGTADVNKLYEKFKGFGYI